MTITRFQEYKYRRTKSLPCPGCGKKVRRTTTFTGTSNPFTTPAYMTYSQMGQRLAPEIKAWMALPVRCKACAAAEEARNVAEAPGRAAEWNAKYPVGTSVSFEYGDQIIQGVTTSEATHRDDNACVSVGIHVPGKGDSWGRPIELLAVVSEAVR